MPESLLARIAPYRALRTNAVPSLRERLSIRSNVPPVAPWGTAQTEPDRLLRPLPRLASLRRFVAGDQAAECPWVRRRTIRKIGRHTAPELRLRLARRWFRRFGEDTHIPIIFRHLPRCHAIQLSAPRHFVPRGGQCDLHWIYLGYADDTPEMRARRLRQMNMIGPAGFISMEDGCIGGFVERGAATASTRSSVVEMGGAGTESQDTRATEAAIRGFWRMWRGMVGV